MAGSWDTYDDATWRISAAFGFIFLLPLIAEVALRFKYKKLWCYIAVGVAFNLIRVILNLTYCQQLFLGNYDYAASLYPAYKTFETLSYLASNASLYQRKLAVVPEKYHLDKFVVGIQSLLNVGSWFTCIIPSSDGTLAVCWAYGDLLTSLSLLLGVLYFDFYYCLKIFKLYNAKGNYNGLIELLIPCIWTSSTSLIVFAGVIAYTMDRGNFFTNGLWNFAVVVVPILTIQSNISSNVGRFVKGQSKTGGMSGREKSSAKLPTLVGRPIGTADAS